MQSPTNAEHWKKLQTQVRMSQSARGLLVQHISFALLEGVSTLRSQVILEHGPCAGEVMSVVSQMVFSCFFTRSSTSSMTAKFISWIRNIGHPTWPWTIPVFGASTTSLCPLYPTNNKQWLSHTSCPRALRIILTSQSDAGGKSEFRVRASIFVILSQKKKKSEEDMLMFLCFQALHQHIVRKEENPEEV